MKPMWMLVALVWGWAVVAQADLVIWYEDFSDVGDWQVIYDPGGNSTITSDGNEGLLYVDASASEAAFGPDTAVAPFVPFDPNESDQYTLSFTVAGLTFSTSYDLALDLFSAADGGSFITTVWQVFPTSGTSVDTGFISVNLGDYTFDPATTHLMPKINVHTGDGAQTVRFDDMTFTLIPEPSAAALWLLGILALGAGRKHYRRCEP